MRRERLHARAPPPDVVVGETCPQPVARRDEPDGGLREARRVERASRELLRGASAHLVEVVDLVQDEVDLCGVPDDLAQQPKLGLPDRRIDGGDDDRRVGFGKRREGALGVVPVDRSEPRRFAGFRDSST
jgi:hypothetical protein